MNKTFVLRDDKNLSRVKQGLFKALKTADLTNALQVELSPYKESKTGTQRASFHLLLGLFATETGYTLDELKLVVKAAAFGTEEKEVFGIDVQIIKSSELAKRNEYAHLIETTYRLAAEAGVILPVLGR